MLTLRLLLDFDFIVIFALDFDGLFFFLFNTSSPSSTGLFLGVPLGVFPPEARVVMLPFLSIVLSSSVFEEEIVNWTML